MIFRPIEAHVQITDTGFGTSDYSAYVISSHLVDFRITCYDSDVLAID